jgi:N-acyl homoserine lactone hydrolase
VNATDVRRLDYGHFVRPTTETGTGHARVEPVLGYAIVHEAGTVLFDTGISDVDAETYEHYRPMRRPVLEVLSEAGIDHEDVALIVNSHLHFDHCGGNRDLTGRPIIVQRQELQNTRSEDYTMAAAVEFPGADYREIDGEVELLPGVWAIATPGHTSGHQSLVVTAADGTIVCAGQTHEFAYEYGSDLLARHVRSMAALADVPDAAPWLYRIQAFDPRRILFAHDLSVLEP